MKIDVGHKAQETKGDKGGDGWQFQALDRKVGARRCSGFKSLVAGAGKTGVDAPASTLPATPSYPQLHAASRQSSNHAYATMNERILAAIAHVAGQVRPVSDLAAAQQWTRQFWHRVLAEADGTSQSCQRIILSGVVSGALCVQSDSLSCEAAQSRFGHV